MALWSVSFSMNMAAMLLSLVRQRIFWFFPSMRTWLTLPISKSSESSSLVPIAWDDRIA